MRAKDGPPRVPSARAQRAPNRLASFALPEARASTRLEGTAPPQAPAPLPAARAPPARAEEARGEAPQNPVEIRDWRLPEEWPTGAKPVTRQIEYDDLYRVSRVDYAYSEGDDDWTSPFETELAAIDGTDDRRRAPPSPHVSFEHRTQWQTFQYDWLGNTANTRDDADGFYDRSLGAITNGGNVGKPYQIHAAQGASGGERGGNLDATYDAAGNLTRLDVRREAEGENCLGGTSCAMRFGYQWDEVGRLVRARRWDLPTNDVGDSSADLPGSAPAADLSYAYDAGDQRVLKTAHDYANDTDSHTAYIFETLELRRAQWLADGAPAQHDYELTEWTEVPYLFANGVRLARVVWHKDDAGNPDLPRPGALTTGQYVLLELGDHLGSTSVVLDQATGELVERSTFYAYGATESDYRPTRWKGFREDYRFTGKEEDVEVGLTYFGKRYLNPLLGRWASPDPLAVHVPGEADLNLYAYVVAHVLRSVDVLGLDEESIVGLAGPPGEDLDAIMASVDQQYYAAGGEVSAPTTAEVQVVEAVSGQPVAGAQVMAGAKSATTNQAGLTQFELADFEASGLHVEPLQVEQPGFETFISEQAVTEGESLSVRLEVGRQITTITMKEAAPDIVLKRYGHSWAEVGGEESYAWWPGWQLGSRGTPSAYEKSGGAVQGVLNAQTWTKGGGTATRDPYHGRAGTAREFHPWVMTGQSASEVEEGVRHFASSYSGRWQWPTGPNCHTFQREMMRELGLASSHSYFVAIGQTKALKLGLPVAPAHRPQ